MVITPVRGRNIPEPENILVTFPNQDGVAGKVQNLGTQMTRKLP